MAVLAALVVGGPVAAADPSPSPGPTPRPPTCAERFPEEGPAGVDLRLGCIVSEVFGLYSGRTDANPPALSTYVLAVLGAILLAFAAVLLVTRALARRAGRRLAPATPGSWWVCAACHSVNGEGVNRCYACGAPPPEGGATLETAAEPRTPQGFGARRKSG